MRLRRVILKADFRWGTSKGEFIKARGIRQLNKMFPEGWKMDLDPQLGKIVVVRSPRV